MYSYKRPLIPSLEEGEWSEPGFGGKNNSVLLNRGPVRLGEEKYPLPGTAP